MLQKDVGAQQTVKPAPEETLKTRVYYENDAAQGMAQGMAEETPVRESLVMRFRSAHSRARRQSKNEVLYSELLSLLDKNPEIARILDLIDRLG